MSVYLERERNREREKRDSELRNGWMQNEN